MYFLMMASYSRKEWTNKPCFHGPSKHVWWALHKIIDNSELCSIRSWDTATSGLSDMNLHDKSRICEHLTCTFQQLKADIQKHVEEALTWSYCTSPMCGFCTKEKGEWSHAPFWHKIFGERKALKLTLKAFRQLCNCTITLNEDKLCTESSRGKLTSICWQVHCAIEELQSVFNQQAL